MKKLNQSAEFNGTITILYDKRYIGKISRGEIRGEWWSEPGNGIFGELIKGKQTAIKYLINKAL